jgi:uncharacterized low-complexity protein
VTGNYYGYIKKTAGSGARCGISGNFDLTSGISRSEPFSAQQLSGGYDLANFEKDAEGKCGEGKCGDDKKADGEAKADGEGKCGEGKCGDDKKADGEAKADGDAKADGEGKCGEGKCGG